MDNKNLLTDKLGEIDSKFLDEYHNRRRRRAVRRKNIIKYGSIAASVIIVITTALIAILPAISNTPINKPTNYTYTLIYADDYQNSNNIDGEKETMPPKPGEVRFRGELYRLMKDDKPYSNYLFAVKMSFETAFEESEECKQMIADAQSRSDTMRERYENEFVPHIKTHSHTQGTMDWTCNECLRLHKLHIADEADIDNMYREVDIILEAEREAHAKKVKERSEAYIASLELDVKNVKVIWADSPEKVDEYTNIWNIQFAYFTKEQLKSLKVPDDIGVELTLIPKWADTGEEVIYRNGDLYPAIWE